MYRSLDTRAHTTGARRPLARPLRVSTLSGALALVLALVLAASAGADTVALNDLPATQAAAQVGARYGVTVRLQGNLRGRVTLSLGEAGAAGACLQAVNALADAVGADYTKTYVVRPDAGRGGPTAARVDLTSPVPLPQGALPAREAIALVAAADDATAEIAGDVAGTVTLSAPSLRVDQAAQEVAAQTHTQWETVYVLTPRAQGRVLGARVIGHTASGSPILQYASVEYRDAAQEAQRRREAEAADREAAVQAQAAQEQMAQEQMAQEQMAQTAGAGGYGPMGVYGASPYGTYGGYGSPSQNSPYGGSSFYGYGGYSPYDGAAGYSPYGGPGYPSGYGYGSVGGYGVGGFGGGPIIISGNRVSGNGGGSGY